MGRAQRMRRPMALLFIDLDHFKDVNDSLGHQVGDEVLRRTAQALQECAQVSTSPGAAPTTGPSPSRGWAATNSRSSLKVRAARSRTMELGERILKRLQEPQSIAGRQVFIGGSIGVALFPQDNTDRDALLKQADMAMYRAKELGRNHVHFFNEELNQSVQERINLEHDLRGALERGEFQLHFQPKADLRSGPHLRLRSLVAVVPTGRGLGGAGPLHQRPGRQPLDSAGGCLGAVSRLRANWATWDAMGLPPVSMAVNLSARQFKSPELAGQIAEVLRPYRHCASPFGTGADRKLADGRQRAEPRHAGAVLHSWACAWRLTTLALGIHRWLTSSASK